MNSLLSTIGSTPLIKLSKLFNSDSFQVYAKLEGQNPGGSIKDRVALYMIAQAEKRNELTPNKTIIEATSGNMGIALAMIGAQKGYKVEIAMSEGMSTERKTMLKALGAKLTLTNKKLGTEGAIQHVLRKLKTAPKKYWFANQFNNHDNTLAHYHSTAPELLSQLPKIDYLIAGLGTSGTIMGLAKRFKKDSPSTKIIGVLPPGGYQIQGLQNPYKDFKGKIVDINKLDQIIEISEKEAYTTTRLAGQKEGLFIGMSSGAALAAVQKTQPSHNSNIVIILPDRGEKYLSTKLFNET